MKFYDIDTYNKPEDIIFKNVRLVYDIKRQKNARVLWIGIYDLEGNVLYKEYRILLRDYLLGEDSHLEGIIERFMDYLYEHYCNGVTNISKKEELKENLIKVYKPVIVNTLLRELEQDNSVFKFKT